VYKGSMMTNDGSTRQVAVKLAQNPADASAKDRAMIRHAFEKEINTLKGKGEHKNVVSTLGFIQDDSAKALGIVCELMLGGTIRQALDKSNAHIDDYQRESWTRQMFNGLKFLHASGIIHRDIKSVNIMLDENWAVAKITDFGLAMHDPEIRASIARASSTGRNIVGTYVNIAPEIIDEDDDGGAKYSLYSDIWAVGVVMFEIFTGGVAFEGKTQKFLMQHVGAEKRNVVDWFVGTKHGAMPEGVELLIRYCSHPVPKERPYAARMAECFSRNAHYYRGHMMADAKGVLQASDCLPERLASWEPVGKTLTSSGELRIMNAVVAVDPHEDHLHHAD